ncbi:MAG: hypothetical protein K2X34_13705 [Hyphomonadaceae bacterium]|nr:hypothetical protein [Hyphomonadaceae bacterium]
MRAALISAFCIALAACSGEQRQGEAEAATPTVLTGGYRAASETTRDFAGDLVIRRGGLVFDRGVVLYTRILNPRSPHERIARNAESYAATAAGAADLSVELRRVTDESVGRGAQSFCDDARPSYVALVHEPRGETVTVLVFAGDEPPGPQATQSRLCAALSYTLREGGQRGVVLW